ncbi:hypothetical protein MTO96_026500 [Rhipicephalus appendiculatus]
MVNVLPNGPFDIGATFSSYEDVQAAIHQYEEENYVQFWVNSSRTIAAAKKKGLTRDVDPALKYAEIEYSCTNGGRKFTSKSTGERPNQKTSKIGCKARIKFITSQDGHALQVKTIETVHNHIVSKGCYEQLPRQRKLTGQQLNDTQKILSLGGNKNLIQSNLWSSGKVVLLRDLRNVQTAAAASMGLHHSESLQSIAAIAKKVGGTLDILANEEDNQLIGIFFQDEDMRSAFKNYPEIVFVDAIHKTNDRRLPLYFICVEDSNGYTEVAGFFLCVSEDENTLPILKRRFSDGIEVCSLSFSAIQMRIRRRRGVTGRLAAFGLQVPAGAAVGLGKQKQEGVTESTESMKGIRKNERAPCSVAISYRGEVAVASLNAVTLRSSK